MTLWGVEDKELYLKSLESYRTITKKKDKFQTYLNKIDSTIKTLKPKIYNPRLLSFDETHEAFLKERIPLTEYFEVYGDLHIV